MHFVIDEFGDLSDEQVEWLRAHLRSMGMVESSVDELVDVDSPDDFLRHGRIEYIDPKVYDISLARMSGEVNRLQANCAALLQRWAIVYNMCQAGGSADNIVAVAKLSAEEVVARGLDYCGERLLRYEKAVHTLRAMKGFLDEGRSIVPGSPQHEYITEALQAMKSYSKEQIAAGLV